MNVFAYLRVSTSEQDVQAQRGAIAKFAASNDVTISRWYEFSISSRKSLEDRGITELLSKLKPGDELIVSEISRLARSVGEIATICDTLLQKRVRLICLKERIDLKRNGRDMDLTSQVQISMFALFAQISRSLTSLRTREGLAATRARGTVLGNPRLSELNDRKKAEARTFALTLEPIVRPMIEKKMSRQAICNELNRRKIKARRGGKWSQLQLSHALKQMEG